MYPFAELTIDQMMKDPIVLALMKADDVELDELQSLLHTARHALRQDNPTSSRARTDREFDAR